MKTCYLLFGGLVILFLSCEKNDKPSDSYPEIPESVYYDVNNDNEDDFIVGYGHGTWDGPDASGDVIFGTIDPLNENAVLVHQEKSSLFLKKNDTVYMEVKEPLSWQLYNSPNLVSVSTSSNTNYQWPDFWCVQRGLSEPYYYLGIKVVKDEKQWVGWLKITIKTSNGIISIEDKALSSNAFIVIDR